MHKCSRACALCQPPRIYAQYAAHVLYRFSGTRRVHRLWGLHDRILCLFRGIARCVDCSCRSWGVYREHFCKRAKVARNKEDVRCVRHGQGMAERSVQRGSDWRRVQRIETAQTKHPVNFQAPALDGIQTRLVQYRRIQFAHKQSMRIKRGFSNPTSNLSMIGELRTCAVTPSDSPVGPNGRPL